MDFFGYRYSEASSLLRRSLRPEVQDIHDTENHHATSTIHLWQCCYLKPWLPGKLEMVEMEVKLEVKMEVEMDAPILQPIYTGAQAPRYM